MLRIADAHAAAIVNGDPSGAAGGVDQGVEERPIGDGVGAVLHGFRFAVRRGDRAAIQMVAADDDGRFQFTAGDQVVESQAEFSRSP